MENRFVTARRNAVWQILKSGATDDEKLDALAAMAERESRQAFGRGLRTTRQATQTPPSAFKAGKIRPV